MKRFFVILLAFLITSSAWAFVPSSKPELLMFDSSKCSICLAFHRDVGVNRYNATKRGRALPLRTVNMDDRRNIMWYREQVLHGNLNPVRGTPTFVIFYHGKEVGRVVGYSGIKWFYRRLDNAVRNAAIRLSKHR